MIDMTAFLLMSVVVFVSGAILGAGVMYRWCTGDATVAAEAFERAAAEVRSLRVENHRLRNDLSITRRLVGRRAT